MDIMTSVQYPYQGIVFLVHETGYRGTTVYAVCDSFDGARKACMEALGLEMRSEKTAGVYWVDEDERPMRKFADVIDSGFKLEMYRDGTPCGMYIECRSVRRK